MLKATISADSELPANFAAKRFPMSIAHFMLLTGVIALVCIAPIHVNATETVQAEEQIDEGIKKFGYLTGLARGCVKPEQHAGLEREALDLSNAIGRLLGTDRAFLFAASFGYGTSNMVEAKDCQDVLSRYEADVEKFRANHGGAK